MIANVEGPVTDNASVSQDSVMGSSDNYRFTFDPASLDALVAHDTCAVNIGNNHIENFGREGITQTKKYLQQRKIAYIGDTGDVQEERARVVLVNGVRVGLVNYNAFVADAYEHAHADLAEIVPQSDVVVVYTHWGVEYATEARTQEREMARAFIDAGADLIIGSHPHVVQNIEEYKGKEIYYSLGNFVFDQYFQPETQKGLLVGVTYDKKRDTLSFRDYAITLQRTGQTVLTASDK
jgi:poly-gamma-glutamate synthesis protein (capsule biosynthesis protein)